MRKQKRQSQASIAFSKSQIDMELIKQHISLILFLCSILTGVILVLVQILNTKHKPYRHHKKVEIYCNGHIQTWYIGEHETEEMLINSLNNRPKNIYSKAPKSPENEKI